MAENERLREVSEPPQTEKMEFNAGDAIGCDLLLFGEVNSSLPYFVYAFEQMGKIGIGKRVNGKPISSDSPPNL